jgi:primosomal protein N' (replication factor Y)
VGGWVIADNVEPPPGIAVADLAQWSGWGPPVSVVDMVDWAAWRWAGPAAAFLRTASPPQMVRDLAAVPEHLTISDAPRPLSQVAELTQRALSGDSPALMRLAPTTDLIDAVITVVNDRNTIERHGSVLVLVPSVGWAERLAARLVRRGYMATTKWDEARAGWPIVVGSRAAAWGPMPNMAAALVLDAHDEAFREQSSPTYNAVDVVVERARRTGTPCILTSPSPSVVLSSGKTTLALSGSAERAGWSTIEVVDRRGADPRTGLFSEEFVRLAHSVLDDPASMTSRGPLVCVFNRKGRSLLLACSHCGELAQCTNCSAAVRQSEGGLVCPRCGEERPMICAACGRLRMKTLRTGVSRLREEIAALLHAEVGEVSGSADDAEVPAAPVLIGTEAVLHRVRRAAAVAFLDIDLHLLAPRFSSTDETLSLLVRASRLVGPRQEGPTSARVLVQTRAPAHPVLVAVERGDPSAVLADEDAIRASSGLPPYSALAVLSGTQAEAFAAEVERVGLEAAVTLSDLPDGGYLVRAPDSVVLSDVLSQVPRPPGRGLRIEVDPTAV